MVVRLFCQRVARQKKVAPEIVLYFFVDALKFLHVGTHHDGPCTTLLPCKTSLAPTNQLKAVDGTDSGTFVTAVYPPGMTVERDRQVTQLNSKSDHGMSALSETPSAPDGTLKKVLNLVM